MAILPLPVNMDVLLCDEQAVAHIGTVSSGGNHYMFCLNPKITAQVSIQFGLVCQKIVLAEIKNTGAAGGCAGGPDLFIHLSNAMVSFKKTDAIRKTWSLTARDTLPVTRE